MTSNAQRKDHPLHAEFIKWRREWERGHVRKANRKKRYDANPEKYRIAAVAYARKHHERALKNSRDYYVGYKKQANRQMRLEMVAAYGGRCVCCGEDNPVFLTLDHTFNDGHKDPLAKGNLKGKYARLGGARFYAILKKHGWPKEKYQLLCYNCNMGKRDNGGTCPHQAKREAVA